MCVLLASLSLLMLLGHANGQSPQQSVLRVDDADVYTSSNRYGIQYSPGWVQLSDKGADGRYLNTLSATNMTAASAVFIFRGSSLAYYGDAPDDHAPVGITLDGRVLETNLHISHTNSFQQLLWSSSELGEGDHQFIVRRGDAGGTQTASIDYLEIGYREDPRPSILGPGATDAPFDNIVDDDHDSIVYQGQWVPNNNMSHFFGNSQHTTTTPGSSLTFTFTGTAVYYFSDTRAQNGWALVSVDGGEGNLVSTFLSSSDNRWFSQVLCWSKTGLSNGPHKVKITHADERGKYVSLDFFKHGVEYGSSGPNLNVTAEAPRSDESKRTPKAAVIAGSAVGAAVLLLAIAACCWFYRRRSQTTSAPGNDWSKRANIPPSTLTADPALRGLSYTSEKWNPDNRNGRLNPTNGPNEHLGLQSYTGLPEPHAV